jgi:hypothetical protein
MGLGEAGGSLPSDSIILDDFPKEKRAGGLMVTSIGSSSRSRRYGLIK